jgi:hypothetical protein
MRSNGYADSGSVVGSLIVTIILWILMSIGAIFIKPFSTTKEPDYIEISITLSDFSSQETGVPAVQEIEPEPAPPIETTEPTEPQNTDTQAVTQTAAQPQPAEPLPTVAETPAVPQTVPATTPVTTPVQQVSQQPAQTVQTQAQTPKPAQTQSQNTTPSTPASQPTQPSVTQTKPQNTTPVQAQTPAPQAQPKPQAKPAETSPVVTQTVEVASEPIVDKTVVAPVTETTTQPAQKEPEPAPVVPVNPAPASTASVENVTNTAPVRTQQPQPTEEEMWAMLMGDDFAGFSNSSSSTKQQATTTTATNELGGAASTAQNQTGQNTTNYSSQNPKKTDSSADSDLEHRLAGMSSTGTGSGSQSGTKTTATENPGMEGDFSWTEGKARKLVKPTDPDIQLSEASKKKIESSLTISISFIVNEAGDIPIDSIKISPPLQWSDVMTDIQQYISRNWRFESSDTKGTATFKFTIKVK